MAKFKCREPEINRIQVWLEKFKSYFREKSGGKTIVALRKVAPTAIFVVLGGAALLAWLGPKQDHTYYRQTAGAQKQAVEEEQGKPTVSASIAALFSNGKKQKEAEQRNQAEKKKKKVAIRYFAPQVLGSNLKGPKAIKSGSKLIGVLLNPIDTRAPSVVRVKIPQGGEASGIVIEQGSTLVGQYSYSGDNDRVYFTFSRVDSPDGESRRIAAVGLDAKDYTPGVSGEEFTGTGVKVAATMGLNMFAGMADTLTDRESLGNSLNGVQAKPSMKNALLQGATRASQDQANRTASSIDEVKSYVIVPEGKEMIIELSEDFGNERAR